MTEAEAAAWLSAAIDGEGHVRKNSNELSITNTSVEFIEQAEMCLERLGVTFTRCSRQPVNRRWKRVYALYVGGVPNMMILHRHLRLVIGYKATALEKAIRDKRIGECPEGCDCGKHTYYPRGSGLGVSWVAARGKFRAYVRTGGKQRHLGYFTDRSDAVVAVTAARRELGLA